MWLNVKSVKKVAEQNSPFVAINYEASCKKIDSAFIAEFEIESGSVSSHF